MSLVLAAAVGGCGGEPGSGYPGPGTVRMAARLDSIAGTVDPETFPYASVLWLETKGTEEPPSDLAGALLFRAKYAANLLYAGRMEEAIDRFARVLEDLERHRSRVPPDFAREVQSLFAISHLQLAEHDNCVRPGRTEHCLIPLGSGGIHKVQRGSLGAVRAYERILGERPDDLGARWLLNVAAMNLGRRPEGLPSRWLIPPEAFASAYPLPRFLDVAHGLEVDALGHAGGGIMDDFDGDGHLDLAASSWGLRDQLRYFRNNGDGTFTDRSIEAGLEGITGGLNLVQTDYNNDGHVDIMVLRGGWIPQGQPNSLLRNNGDGTFEDVTEAAGLLEPWYPSQSAAWGDFDNDGWLDVYVGNESWTATRNPGQLFRNNGDGTFTDIAREVGADVAGIVKGVTAGDFDNDGRLDLYLSRWGQPNVLLRNSDDGQDGQWRFVDVTDDAGVAEPTYAFPAWFWDFDNDGWLDLFVAGYRSPLGDVAAEYLDLPHRSELPRLYRNTGGGRFRDVTADVQLAKIMFAMGANFGDVDGDGYLDFYVGTGDMDMRALIPNRMWRNAAGTSFQDVTTAAGVGHRQKGHGIAFGDIDNDGDEDIYAVMGGAHEADVAHNVLFENPARGHHWITLRLQGVRSNRAAIGARITVTAVTHDGPRHIHRVVSSGGSFGANSLQQEIGLGTATAIREVAVTWPATGTTDVYTELEMDRIYRIREGDAVATPVAQRRLSLSRHP